MHKGKYYYQILAQMAAEQKREQRKILRSSTPEGRFLRRTQRKEEIQARHRNRIEQGKKTRAKRSRGNNTLATTPAQQVRQTRSNSVIVSRVMSFIRYVERRWDRKRNRKGDPAEVLSRRAQERYEYYRSNPDRITNPAMG